MGPEPAVVREEERGWETMGDEAGSGVVFKTLISGGITPGESLTLGIAKVPPGDALRGHCHRRAEVYLVLSGSGSVKVGDEVRPVEAGCAVFVPGDVLRACENTGGSELRLAYVLDADSFDDVEYVFGP